MKQTVGLSHSVALFGDVSRAESQGHLFGCSSGVLCAYRHDSWKNLLLSGFLSQKVVPSPDLAVRLLRTYKNVRFNSEAQEQAPCQVRLQPTDSEAQQQGQRRVRL